MTFNNKNHVKLFIYKLKHGFEQQEMDTHFIAYLCCTFNGFVVLYI